MSVSKAQPIPQGKYIAANRYGSIIYSAGMTSRINGVLMMSGKVQTDKPLESYRQAVVQAACNALTAVRSLLNTDERIVTILTMSVFVNAEVGYKEHSKLADFASDYLCSELGESGVTSRAAIGVASLPGDAPVEIQLIAAVE